MAPVGAAQNGSADVGEKPLEDEVREMVSSYYGDTLKSTSDLKTSACCPTDAVPEKHKAILGKLHPEVMSRFYGCGSPIPEGLNGATVLDLGCGTGRDVYLASALVGTSGRVIGVDMTDEQLEVARRHVDFHTRALLGEEAEPNVEFRKGVIEDLSAAGIEDNTADVVISNCVCNLSPNKPRVFAEVYRSLKEGGEFYFSDIYADRRLSEAAQKHPVLVGECLGGALYIEDFRRIMANVGFKDVRIVSCSPVTLNDEELCKLVPGTTFFSITCRAFKIDGMEDRPEDFGQTATYSSCCGDGLDLDAILKFKKKATLPVDGNTAKILTTSRFASKFTVTEPGPHKGPCVPTKRGACLDDIMAALVNQRQMSSSCCATAPDGSTVCRDDTQSKNGGCCGP